MPRAGGDVPVIRCLREPQVEVRDFPGCVAVFDPGDPSHEIPLRMDWGEPTRNTPAAAGLGPPPPRSLRPPGRKRMITDIRRGGGPHVHPDHAIYAPEGHRLVEDPRTHGGARPESLHQYAGLDFQSLHL